MKDESNRLPCALIVMGVSGSGKSTIAASLAARLGWTFEDGDRFHPASNVAKMAAGHPLTDEDRWPWLQAIAEPMLVVIGDEDETTHGLAVHIKQHVARSGVLELPKCGHTINLEEPAAFNAAVQDFFHAVEQDRWPARGAPTYSLIPPKA